MSVVAAKAVSVSAAAKAISTSAVGNPGIVNATGHGFVPGDTITIASHTGSTPDINGTQTVATTPTADQFTLLGVNVTVGGTGGTAAKTSSTSLGLAGYPHRILVHNLGPNAAYLGEAAVTTAAGYRLSSGAREEFNAELGRLFAITAAAESADLRVMEVFP